MGNAAKREQELINETTHSRHFNTRYLVTLDDIRSANDMLIMDKWVEKFWRWGAIDWGYIPTNTTPPRLMLLIYVNNEINLSWFPMFVGGLEIVPIVVRRSKIMNAEILI